VVGNGNNTICQGQALHLDANGVDVVDVVFAGYEPTRWSRHAQPMAPPQSLTKPNSMIVLDPAQKISQPPRPDLPRMFDPPSLIDTRKPLVPVLPETLAQVDKAASTAPDSRLDEMAADHESDCATTRTFDFTDHVIVGLNALHGQKKSQWTRISRVGFAPMFWLVVVAFLVAIVTSY
jgi:hypothetical protein